MEATKTTEWEDLLYRDCWIIAADSVASMRRVDVFRVLARAQDVNALGYVAARLSADRPDFAARIAADLPDARAGI